MNRSLFTSRLHAPIALLVAIAFAGWLAYLGGAPGWHGAAHRDYLLGSGWGAFALMVVCLLYVPRKYAYKALARLRELGDALARTKEGGWILRALRPFRPRRGEPPRLGRPEVRGFELAGLAWGGERVERARVLRDRQSRLEETEEELARTRVEIEKGRLRSRREIRRAMRAVLRRRGVLDLARPMVRPGDPDRGEPRWVVALRPREPLRRMGVWLHAHLWYGLAFAVLVGLHGGGSMASALGILLNALSLIVVSTGIAGIFLFAWGPARLARAEERAGIGYEQALVLDDHVARKIDALVLEGGGRAIEGAADISRSAWRAGRADPRTALALAEQSERDPDREAKLRDLAVLTAQKRRYAERRTRLRRARFLMHLWRAVHVPASLLLAALVVVHVLSVWWY